MARTSGVDLTPDLIEALSEGYRIGMPMAQVAGLAGVHPETLRRWIKAGTDELARRAESPDTPPIDDKRLDAYVALAEAIKAADGRFVQENLLLIRRAATEAKTRKKITKTAKDGTVTVEEHESTGGQWAAAAWLLERRHTQEYGRQIRQLEVGPSDQPAVSREQRAEEVAAWLERLQAGEPVELDPPIQDAEIVEDEPVKVMGE